MGLAVFRMRGDAGQMTIEFVVAFPAMLIVAAIAVNACAFFELCAAFDNNFRDAVRTCAASPAYGQDVGQSCSLIEQELQRERGAENVQVQVSARSVAQGHTTFAGTLRFEPTLFGIALKPQVFGVSLPALSHSEEITVDCYKPGALL